jgi:hypothetical protein
MCVVSVTADSPEKQRVGMIGHYHGAADQAWSSAEVTAAVVFQTERRDRVAWSVGSANDQKAA